MKKVLVVITTELVSYGGLTTVMMNYYRKMDSEGLCIDFASTNKMPYSDQASIFKTETRYFSLGSRKKDIIKYIRNLYKLLRAEKYDVIHVNGNSATMVIELFVAKFCRVPVRIAHGHTTKSNYPIIHKILSPIFRKTYTHAIATSVRTGDWLYGKDYIILNNAIDIDHYGFSQETRDEIRTKLNLHGKYVIGNVGKLNSAKNHHFLLEIFSQINKRNPNTMLVIAGGGVLENELKEHADKLGISDSTIFLGMINDTRDILQAMDVFVFPSIFEGLGMALIEAQATGLKCIASTAVPKEAKVSPYVKFVDLKGEIEMWIAEILTDAKGNRKERSFEAKTTIRNYGYDIKHEAHKLRDLYLGESR